MAWKVLLVVGGTVVALAAGYAGWSVWLLAGRPGDVPRLAADLGIGPGATVADVGAGDGRWAKRMATLVGDAGLVYATEIDPQQLERLEAVAARTRNVVVRRATPDDVGLPAACCDAIWLRGVYHHLTDPERTLQQLGTALQPGGRLAILDFSPDGPWRWHFWLHPEDAAGRRSGHGVRREDVAVEARRAGFDVIRHVGGWSGGYHLTLLRPKRPTS